MLCFVALFVLGVTVASSQENLSKSDANIETSLQKSMEAMTRRMQILENRISQYDNALDRMNYILKEKEQKDNDIQMEIKTLKSRIEKLESENQRLSKDNSVMKKMLSSESEDSSASIQKENKRTLDIQGGIRSVPMPVVAFYAQAVSKLAHLGPDQPLVFEHVITNVGNAYNAHTGEFIAPVSGVYVFAMSIMTAGMNHSYVGLVYNGHVISTLLMNDQLRDSASQQVILEMQKGDDLSIRNVIFDRSYEGGDQTVFSGFLLSDTGSLAIMG